MIRYLVYLIEIILCYLLQTSVFANFRVFGVVPDCFLILIIVISLTRGQNQAIAVGFFSGLLLDLMFSETIGTCSIIYMFIAYIAGRFNRMFDPHSLIVPAIAIFTGELFYSLAYYIFGFFLLGKTSLGSYMLNMILPRAFYTLVVAVLLYPLFLFVQKKLMSLEGFSNE